MTGTEQDTTDGAPARTLLAGCAFLLLLVGGVVGLSFLLYDSLTGPPPVDRDDRPPATTPDGGRLTRTRRLELVRELEQVERDLEFARAQARVAIDPATRQAWNDRATGLAAERDTLRDQLGR